MDAGKARPGRSVLAALAALILAACLAALARNVWAGDLAHGCVPTARHLCNTAENKLPALDSARGFTLPSIESELDASTVRAFEHAFGRALAGLPIVENVTAHVVHRLHAFLRGASGLPEPELLRRAFGTGSRGNTGYVGAGVEALRAVLAEGNQRERWSLVYILQKNGFLDGLFEDVAANKTRIQELGLSTAAVRLRAAELRTTRSLPKAMRYANGIADWLFPSFDSWVRFDFDGPALVDAVQSPAPLAWRACRVRLPGGCERTALRADDPEVFPPLSERERAYQCAERAAAEPCRLHWLPGSGCYNLVDSPLRPGALAISPAAAARARSAAVTPAAASAVRDRHGLSLPGYVARARALGMRAVAGPSGTTTNTLQMARLLGVPPQGLCALRLAMVSWLLLSDDHSLWEVLLAAEPFMPRAWRISAPPPPRAMPLSHWSARAADAVWPLLPAVRSTLQLGSAPRAPPAADSRPAPAGSQSTSALCSLIARLVPHTLRWNGHELEPAEMWAAVRTALGEAAGGAVWDALGDEQRAFVQCASASARPAVCCRAVAVP